jgi:hypothetical protein
MKKLLIGIVVLVLLFLLATPVLASPPPDNPGNGPPIYEKTVFIHYGKDIANGKPAGKPGGGTTSKLYSYSGIHWANSDIPVDYYINSAGSPVAPANAQLGITASFQTWENDQKSYIDFTYMGNTGIVPGLNATAPDYTNVVGWADLSNTSYSGAIGVTIIWSLTGLKHIVDCDTVLNSAAMFAWTQADIGSTDPDTVQLPNTSLYDVDVQNIMTHEAGHWLMLNDLYDSVAIEQTMYGYAYDRELKARSLESGDMAGVRKIYP